MVAGLIIEAAAMHPACQARTVRMGFGRQDCEMDLFLQGGCSEGAGAHLADLALRAHQAHDGQARVALHAAGVGPGAHGAHDERHAAQVRNALPDLRACMRATHATYLPCFLTPGNAGAADCM